MADAQSILDRLGAYIAEALKFWEPLRLLYNAVLFTVVLLHFRARSPESWSRLSFNVVLGLFVLAVLANIAYCAAYAVDIFVQLSGLKRQWKVGRMVLFVIGALFGAVLAHFFVDAMFIGSGI